MVTTYAQHADVSNFLKLDAFTACTVPSIANVESIINRMEDRFDQRTGHAWRLVTITNEHHDLPLIYSFGWGTLISLQHRMVQPLSAASCDFLGIWQGTAGCFNCILATGNFQEIPERGEIYIRGHLFSVMRKNRVRITYRYGGEPTDGATPTVPFDIEDAIVKMVAIDLITTSFRFDVLPRGGGGTLSYDLDKATARWREDIDRIVRNREEFFVLTI